MSVNRVRQEIRSAKYQAVNRTGLTVGDLRAFLAEADEAELPADGRVRIDIEPFSEGGNRTVRIESSVTVPLAATCEADRTARPEEER